MRAGGVPVPLATSAVSAVQVSSRHSRCLPTVAVLTSSARSLWCPAALDLLPGAVALRLTSSDLRGTTTRSSRWTAPATLLAPARATALRVVAAAPPAPARRPAACDAAHGPR